MKEIFEQLSQNISNKELIIDGKTTHKYLEKIFKTKDEYFGKFQKYFYGSKNLDKTEILLNQSIIQSSKLLYYEHFYNEQKTLIPKIIGQFSE